MVGQQQEKQKPRHLKNLKTRFIAPLPPIWTMVKQLFWSVVSKQILSDNL